MYQNIRLSIFKFLIYKWKPLKWIALNFNQSILICTKNKYPSQFLIGESYTNPLSLILQIPISFNTLPNQPVTLKQIYIKSTSYDMTKARTN